HIRYVGQIFLTVFPSRFCLSLFDHLFEGAQEGGLVGALQRPIALYDAFGSDGMRPQRNPASAEKRVPDRMIEVIVRVQPALDGNLADHPQSLHLEGSPSHTNKSLDQQRAILADQKSSVANC